jgi:hypothetical protein
MAATRLRIFISSVQSEFKTVRHDLKAFLLGDAFLRRFVAEVFLFEDLPASDQRAEVLLRVGTARPATPVSRPMTPAPSRAGQVPRAKAASSAAPCHAAPVVAASAAMESTSPQGMKAQTMPSA